MNKKEKIAYWLDIADYDLGTAKAMMDTSRYLYVIFMCQQAVEKIIKALYIQKHDDEPPRSHNVAFVFKKTEIEASQETIQHFNLLSAYYIESRYPEYKEKLSSIVDRDRAVTLLKKTEEVYAWLKSLLK
jgi:HEPN domain-containing protein